MPVKPSAPKHRTEILGDKLIISMPSLKLWPFLLVFSIWSLFWFGTEVATISAAILTFKESNLLDVILFIIWFIFWNVLGILLIYNILWQLFGKEEIKITNQSITISQVVFAYKRSKEYLSE